MANGRQTLLEVPVKGRAHNVAGYGEGDHRQPRLQHHRVAHTRRILGHRHRGERDRDRVVGDSEGGGFCFGLVWFLSPVDQTG